MTDEELEDLAFLYANSSAVPEGCRDFIKELWWRYCAATTLPETAAGLDFKPLYAGMTKRETFPTVRPRLRLVGADDIQD